MSILSGFKKVKRYIKLPDGYKKLSIWTSSQTVEMDDGTTLESNKTKWDDASNKKHEHSNKDALDSITSNNITKWNDMSTNIDATIALKANQSELDTHVNDNTIHITADERTKLSGIAAGANKYTHPPSAAGAKASGLYKIITDANGHVTGATAVTKADITALGIPSSDTNTTYGTGTSSVAGLTKLYTSTGTSTDGTMTRDAITKALSGRVYTKTCTSNSTFDFTNAITGYVDGFYVALFKTSRVNQLFFLSQYAGVATLYTEATGIGGSFVSAEKVGNPVRFTIPQFSSVITYCDCEIYLLARK